ncbi:MAG: NAD(P)H-dependent glycerol-3-phosphate dehydrogenase [Bacteroidales bacterium]|nr:NAD(P)H-dependent glycerol-3-phosphate dehydrogenase [Bacteroidales bacterium]MCF8327322.1 NAD(P)H-dependent glycerol-3-phosphate dehydrogenase [Bacteroidales bacterium]
MLNKENHIAVLGGGSWGTALVKLLSENTKNLHWWMRSAKTINHIKEYGKNPDYLPYAELDKDIDVSDNINEVIRKSDVVVIAIPSAFLKSSVIRVKPEVLQKKKFFSAVKGIIPGQISTVTELLNKYFDIPLDHLGVISGPCHSEEVAMEKLSFLTIGTYNKELAEFMKTMLSSWFMKITLSDDVRGIEYASILKNVVAIASGISLGLGYGDNFQSVLITNAVREMKTFLKTMDCNGREIEYSVYLGDVMVTAYSKFSRNRMLGTMLGKGYTLKASLTEMKMVAEGYYAVDSLMKIANAKNLHLPVMEAVHNIIYKGNSAEDEFVKLSDHLS